MHRRKRLPILTWPRVWEHEMKSAAISVDSVSNLIPEQWIITAKTSTDGPHPWRYRSIVIASPHWLCNLSTHVHTQTNTAFAERKRMRDRGRVSPSSSVGTTRTEIPNRNICESILATSRQQRLVAVATGLDTCDRVQDHIPWGRMGRRLLMLSLTPIL